MVITGGSRGLGLALANEFLSLGDQVVIAARDEAACAAAVRQLQQQHPQSQVHQTTCDVTQPDQMQHLAAFAQEKLGQVDIWVNNAGCSQIPKAPLADTATEQIQRIVGTNMLGTLLGSQAAIQTMRSQASGDASSAENCSCTQGMSSGSAHAKSDVHRLQVKLESISIYPPLPAVKDDQRCCIYHVLDYHGLSNHAR